MIFKKKERNFQVTFVSSRQTRQTARLINQNRKTIKMSNLGSTFMNQYVRSFVFVLFFFNEKEEKGRVQKIKGKYEIIICEN